MSPFRTFTVGDVDKDEARLRVAAIGVTSLGAGLFALAHPGPLAITVSLAAIAAGIAWARRANAAGSRAASRTQLVLAPTGLTLTPQPELPWAEIASVEVDEDRLVVLVRRTTGEPLVLEPVYDGVSVYELAQAVVLAKNAAGR